GWSGTLELAEGASVRARLPVAFAPGQPLFWSLSANRRGHLTLHFAPAGYRPAGLSIQSRHEEGARGSATAIRAVSLGSEMNGSHPLNGRIGGARLTPLPRSEERRVGKE